MRTRLLKECRSLLLPAGLALGATVISAALVSLRDVGPRGVLETLSDALAFLGLYLGTGFVAVSPFGAEFQQRTIVLLLAQPISRARLWLEKSLVLAAVMAIVAAVAWLVPHTGALAREGAAARGAAYVLMMGGSAAFWTLLTRSTLGGLVLSFSAIMMLELASGYVMILISGGPLLDDMFSDAPAIAMVRVAYSALTWWLGWRLFSRFQAVGAGVGEGSAGWLDATPLGSLLRSRPTGALANLVRKEVHLQRPTLAVAALFSAGWLATIAVVWLGLAPPRYAEAAFALLLFANIPLIAMLAGTVSIGEETTHGTREWQLTLPVSTRAQWTVKLGVSLAMGLVLAVGLPAALAALAAAARSLADDTLAFRLVDRTFVLLVTGGIVLGFWAATLAGHTVRAAALAGVALLVLALVTSFGIRWGESWRLQTGLVTALMVRLQLPPDYFVPPPFAAWAPLVLTMAAVLLWQSLSAFRRPGTNGRMIARDLLTLAALALIVASLTWNFAAVSSRQAAAAPVQELRAGLRALSSPDGAVRGPWSRQVTPADLERVTPLSASTRRWLANTEISIETLGPRPPATRAGYLATVEFPGHRMYRFVYFVE